MKQDSKQMNVYELSKYLNQPKITKLLKPIENTPDENKNDPLNIHYTSYTFIENEEQVQEDILYSKHKIQYLVCICCQNKKIIKNEFEEHIKTQQHQDNWTNIAKKYNYYVTKVKDILNCKLWDLEKCHNFLMKYTKEIPDYVEHILKEYRIPEGNPNHPENVMKKKELIMFFSYLYEKRIEEVDKKILKRYLKESNRSNRVVIEFLIENFNIQINEEDHEYFFPEQFVFNENERNQHIRNFFIYLMQCFRDLAVLMILITQTNMSLNTILKLEMTNIKLEEQFIYFNNNYQTKIDIHTVPNAIIERFKTQEKYLLKTISNKRQFYEKYYFLLDEYLEEMDFGEQLNCLLQVGKIRQFYKRNQNLKLYDVNQINDKFKNIIYEERIIKSQKKNIDYEQRSSGDSEDQEEQNIEIYSSEDENYLMLQKIKEKKSFQQKQLFEWQKKSYKQQLEQKESFNQDDELIQKQMKRQDNLVENQFQTNKINEEVQQINENRYENIRQLKLKEKEQNKQQQQQQKQKQKQQQKIKKDKYDPDADDNDSDYTPKQRKKSSKKSETNK